MSGSESAASGASGKKRPKKKQGGVGARKLLTRSAKTKTLSFDQMDPNQLGAAPQSVQDRDGGNILSESWGE